MNDQATIASLRDQVEKRWPLEAKYEKLEGEHAMVVKKLQASQQAEAQKISRHRTGNRVDGGRFPIGEGRSLLGARILLTAVLLLAACDKPEIAPNATGGEAAARGKTAAGGEHAW